MAKVMRKRPKLLRALQTTFAGLAVDPLRLAEQVVADLDAAGYVVVEKATRGRWDRENGVNAMRRINAEQARESALAWGRGLAKSERHLQDRCSALWEALGALVEAARSMPDAGLDDSDPRRAWWFNTLCPARFAAEAVLRPAHIDASSDPPISTPQGQ